MILTERLTHYSHLMRLNKPIGILLLLWPTLWGLWLAGDGHPDAITVSIFVVGVCLMRSAGCVVNDMADRKFDGYVKRTRERVLASNKVSVNEALFLASMLALAAFVLVLFCNALTIALAFVGLGLAIVYPFLKRITHLPQMGLGIAFAWGIPMAFAAETGRVGASAWWLFVTAVVWTIIYDTMYAMVDRDDDVNIGIKSTAILFGRYDRFILGLLQALFMLLLVVDGVVFYLEPIYYVSLLVVLGLCVYQQWLIKESNRDRCFAAFINNNWVGMVVFVGMVVAL